MCGPLCSVAPMGTMTVVLPAPVPARTSVQVRSSRNTDVGVCAAACAAATTTTTAARRAERIIGGHDSPCSAFSEPRSGGPIQLCDRQWQPAHRIAALAVLGTTKWSRRRRAPAFRRPSFTRYSTASSENGGRPSAARAESRFRIGVSHRMTGSSACSPWRRWRCANPQRFLRPRSGATRLVHGGDARPGALPQERALQGSRRPAS